MPRMVDWLSGVIAVSGVHTRNKESECVSDIGGMVFERARCSAFASSIHQQQSSSR